MNYDLDDSTFPSCSALGVLCARASGVASRVAVERYSGPEGVELGYWWVFVFLWVDGWMDGWMEGCCRDWNIMQPLGVSVSSTQRYTKPIPLTPLPTPHASSPSIYFTSQPAYHPPKNSTGNLLQLFNAKGLRFHHDLTRLYGDVVKIWGFFGVSRPCSPLQLNFS